MYSGYITDVEGIKVGHKEDSTGKTGVTTIICDDGFTAGADVRGAAPGTREIALLESEKMVQKVHGIVLSGGSAYGLDSCSGVMKSLEEKEIGFDVGVAKVPIVCGAVIFDLDNGDPSIRPNFEMGYNCALSASIEENRQGIIGAGAGARTGKMLGPKYSSKSGLGSATVKSKDLIVSAMVVVNAAGNVYDISSDKIISGAYDKENNKFIDIAEFMKINDLTSDNSNSITNTTLAVVATNGNFNKTQCNIIAKIAHDGFARVIKPTHTMIDGDTVFAVSTNKVSADINLACVMAVEAVEKAIINAVMIK